VTCLSRCACHPAWWVLREPVLRQWYRSCRSQVSVLVLSWGVGPDLPLLSVHNHSVFSMLSLRRFANHHNFATVRHRVMPFSAKCSERKCVQCLNTAIKYSLLFGLQVNYLKTKQSTWWHITFFYHICNGIYAILRIYLAVRRRLHGKKKSFHPRTKYDWSCSESCVSSNACMHSIVSVCLLLSATELLDIETLWAANHSWQFSQLKNVKFQSLSRSPVDSYLSLVLRIGCKLSY